MGLPIYSVPAQAKIEVMLEEEQVFISQQDDGAEECVMVAAANIPSLIRALKLAYQQAGYTLS